MSRKADLEQHIRASYDLIREYEAILQTSSDPKEKARAQRVIQEQWSLIQGYQSEYRRLTTDPFPADIAEIAAYFIEDNDPPQFPSSQAVPLKPAGNVTYVTHIQHAEGIAIGDNAQVISSREHDLKKESNTSLSTMKIALTLYDPELADLTEQLTLLIPSKDPNNPRKAEQISFRLYLLNPSDKIARYIQIEMSVKAHFLAYQYKSEPLSIEPLSKWEFNRVRDNMFRCFLEGGADLVCHKRKWRELGIVNMQIPCGEADGGEVKVEISYKIEAEEHTGNGLLIVLLQSSANWR